jgi:hypothetical protein
MTVTTPARPRRRRRLAALAGIPIAASGLLGLTTMAAPPASATTFDDCSVTNLGELCVTYDQWLSSTNKLYVFAYSCRVKNEMRYTNMWVSDAVYGKQNGGVVASHYYGVTLKPGAILNLRCSDYFYQSVPASPGAYLYVNVSAGTKYARLWTWGLFP